MKIRDFVVAVLMFSGVMTGISVFMADVSMNFNKETKDLTGLSQADEIAKKTLEFEKSLKTKMTGIEFIDNAISVMSGFAKFIDLVGSSLFGFWDNLINGVSKYLFIPMWAIGIISAIVTSIILFEIVSAIIKWNV